MSAPLLSLRGLEFAYPGRPRILHQVDFDLHAGERVALVGGNGAGKSTLLSLMLGLRRPHAGRIEIFGEARAGEAAFRPIRGRVGLLFQDPDDQLFCPTVLEDVSFGPLNQGQSAAQARQTALATLAELGLGEYADRVTHKLSGGEKRLISLAAVLAMRPEVLLLDEPTTGLDHASDRRLVAYLHSLPQAMVFVSHDRHFVQHLATRAVTLHQCRLVDALIHTHPHTHTHAHPHIHGPGSDSGHEHRGVAPEHGDHHDA